jgi:hypothetical protein
MPDFAFDVRSLTNGPRPNPLLPGGFSTCAVKRLPEAGPEHGWASGGAPVLVAGGATSWTPM